MELNVSRDHTPFLPTVHGVSESWIVDFINQSHRNIPPSRILTAIDRLVETSDIYPVGPKVYKTVS